MQKLQQFRLTLDKGKETKKEKVGEVKKVIDSSAEILEMQGKALVNEMTEASKRKRSIEIFNVWENQGEITKEKKTTKKK